MNISKGLKRTAAIAACALVAAAPSFGAPADWPNYALRIISVHPLGSVDDPISKPIAEQLKQASKFQVALQHHLLDAPTSGVQVIADSVPNGQSLGVLGSDPRPVVLKPISLLAKSPLVLATHPQQSYQGFQDVIQAARRRPGQVLIGATGGKSWGQLAIEEFNAREAVTLKALLYKANAPLVADLISGRIGLAVMPLSVALPHAKAGRIKVIGISSKAADPRLAQVRPLAAQGLADYELHAWWGAFVAPKVSDDIANQISARLISLGQDSKFLQAMHSMGVDLQLQDSAALIRALETDNSRWAAHKGN